MRLFDAFAGIGGFSLGAHRAGWKTVGFCEIDPACQRVLRKNFPNIPIANDVRELDGSNISAEAISGGFPCTDLSNAAKGSHLGLEGSQSGLFFSLARAIRDSDVKWAVIENVPRVIKYLDRIKEELPQYGWSFRIFDAADFGAACRRRRAYLVGCTAPGSAEQVLNFAESRGQTVRRGGDEDVLPMLLPWKGGVSLERLASCVVEDTEADAARIREGDGVPRGMDGPRYLMLGNSVTPVIPYWIFRGISHTEAV
jgi:DNA-cytosine methyltransferase